MKKVLVITYYWPPSGGGGVQRWLKFTRYLPEFGWEPIVLTPSNPSVLEQDTTLENELSEATKVVKIPIWEPYSIASALFNVQAIPKQGIVNASKSNRFSVLTWIRGNLLIPDARIFWRKTAVKKAIGIIKKEKIDLVVTTGPPHSLHLIGLDVKKATGITWVADFRDPWADWDILDQMKLTKMARNKHKKLEQNVVKSADGILTVSNAWAEDFSKKYHKSIKVITNGFEKEAIGFSRNVVPDKFRISHFGLINTFRDVPDLWMTLTHMCEENETFKNDLELFLAGNIDQVILDEISKSAIRDKIKIAGYLPHEALAEEYHKTAVFLLLSNNTKNAKGHIPGKLFEYLHHGKPVLAFCEKNGDTAEIIDSTNSGYVLAGNDSMRIRKAIEELYKKYKSKDVTTQPKEISKYDRRNLSMELSVYFDELTAKK